MSNRISLAQLRELAATEVATLPIDQIALLLEDVTSAKDDLKELDDCLHDALTLRCGAEANTLRLIKGVDTGRVWIAEGEHRISCDAPKKVAWDQKALAGVVKKLQACGEDPAEYVQTTLSVPERSYEAWPKGIRMMFDGARTVSVGKQKFFIEGPKS